MDAERFDRLSRMFGRRLNRRDAVRAAGVSGAALAASSLDRASIIRAQDNKQTCEVELTATVRLGPSVDTMLGGDEEGELHGVMRFGLRDGGSLSDGTLELDDGTVLDVEGQTNSTAITLRIEIPLGGVIVLVGVGDRAIRACDGQVDGLLTGPQPGDIGDWHGIAVARESEAGTNDTAPAPTAPTVDDPGSSAPDPTVVPPGGCSAEGDFCDEDNDCCSINCEGGECVCSPPGGICSVANGVDTCCAPAICGAGACYLPDGAACQNDSECLNYCVGGICTPNPPVACSQTGGPCTGENYCCFDRFCNQDGICECVPAGAQCAGIDNGACCSGTCNAEGTCQ